MAKKILYIFLTFVLTMMPTGVSAHSEMQDTDAAVRIGEDIRLTISGQNARVQNAQGAVLEVFSITGTKVLSVKIESADKTVNLNLSRGCYIVKVGNIARKVSIL